MSSAALATAVMAGAALVSFAPAANASTVFNFNGSSMTPAFTADVSLNVAGGNASSGTGTITFGANSFDLTLITPLTPGNESSPGPVGYRDHLFTTFQRITAVCPAFALPVRNSSWQEVTNHQLQPVGTGHRLGSPGASV